jgi:hypothetical protein
MANRENIYLPVRVRKRLSGARISKGKGKKHMRYKPLVLLESKGEEVTEDTVGNFLDAVLRDLIYPYAKTRVFM